MSDTNLVNDSCYIQGRYFHISIPPDRNKYRPLIKRLRDEHDMLICLREKSIRIDGVFGILSMIIVQDAWNIISCNTPNGRTLKGRVISVFTPFSINFPVTYRGFL